MIIPKEEFEGVASMTTHYPASHSSEEVIKTMTKELKEWFKRTFKSYPPDSWFESYTEAPTHTEVKSVVLVRAPLKGNSIWLVPNQSIKTSALQLTPDSKITKVNSPFQNDGRTAHTHPNHFLQFVGWDTETGLMAFDDIKENNRGN